jgi:regulator of sigma E protease
MIEIPAAGLLLKIALGIGAIGILIVVHEFGHFIVAKAAGVGVLKFSVGFGPKLLGRRVGDTEYVISAIPFGGFVKMVGEDPDAEEPVDPRISFSHQPLWKRIAIVIAGPAFNLLFAFLTYSLILLAYGKQVQSEDARVGDVEAGMPAAAAGLQPGDLVTAIDGGPIESWVAMAEKIRGSAGEEIELTLRRGEESVTVRLTPQSAPVTDLFGEEVDRAYRIGIAPAFDRMPVGPIQCVVLGVQQTYFVAKTLVVGVARMIQLRISSKEIGGPILIVQAAAQQAKAGMEAFASFLAFISINLGVLNLLPIPILDGGHLLFFGIEAVMRRPLDARHRLIAQQVGFAILLCLMLFAVFNDITRNMPDWG